MPKLSRLLTFFSLLLLAVFARSQSTVTSVQAGNSASPNSGGRTSLGMVAGFGGISGVGMRRIKGQPFSADVVEETDQYPADYTVQDQSQQ